MVSAVARASRLVRKFALRHGILIQRVPPHRHGDPFADQAALLRKRRVTTIFDVGAYVGETALAYRALFPDAEIHCFEPVATSFEQLNQVLGDDRRAILNRLALGAASGPVEMIVNSFAATSSILSAVEEAPIGSERLFETVERQVVDSTTIDGYLESRGIEEIDILKIDIQGGELAALEGAAHSLEEGRVGLIYMEILVAPLYESQPGVGQVLSAAERYGYRLHGLYNLVYQSQSGLSQMDAILTR